LVPRRGPRFRVYLNPYTYRYLYLLTHSLVSVTFPFARLKCFLSRSLVFSSSVFSARVVFLAPSPRSPPLSFGLLSCCLGVPPRFCCPLLPPSLCLLVPFPPFCLLRFVIPVACRVSVSLASAPFCAARSLFLCARRLVLPPLSFARCCLPLLSPRFAAPFVVCLVLPPVPAPPAPALRVLPPPLLPSFCLFSCLVCFLFPVVRFSIVLFL